MYPIQILFFILIILQATPLSFNPIKFIILIRWLNLTIPNFHYSIYEIQFIICQISLFKIIFQIMNSNWLNEVNLISIRIRFLIKLLVQELPKLFSYQLRYLISTFLNLIVISLPLLLLNQVNLVYI